MADDESDGLGANGPDVPIGNESTGTGVDRTAPKHKGDSDQDMSSMADDESDGERDIPDYVQRQIDDEAKEHINPEGNNSHGSYYIWLQKDFDSNSPDSYDKIRHAIEKIPHVSLEDFRTEATAAAEAAAKAATAVAASESTTKPAAAAAFDDTAGNESDKDGPASDSKQLPLLPDNIALLSDDFKRIYLSLEQSNQECCSFFPTEHLKIFLNRQASMNAALASKDAALASKDAALASKDAALAAKHLADKVKQRLFDVSLLAEQTETALLSLSDFSQAERRTIAPNTQGANEENKKSKQVDQMVNDLMQNGVDRLSAFAALSEKYDGILKKSQSLPEFGRNNLRQAGTCGN